MWSCSDAQLESDCACPDDGFKPRLDWYPYPERIESDCACPAHAFDVDSQDCACPDDGFLPSTASTLNPTIAWQAAPALYRAPLPDDHELAFNPFGGVGVTVLNTPARRVLDAFAQPRPLPQAIVALNPIAPIDVIRVSNEFVALGLLHPLGAMPTIKPVQPHTLTVWLHVTNACNLRCAYCYVDKTDRAMDESVGIAAVQAIFRSAVTHGFRSVKLKYAGGEPTLNFDLVMKLHTHARQLADSTGLELREVILSNGTTLTAKMLDAIHDFGMRLMISLDGIGAANDSQRAFANGRGSYLLIASAIERARIHDVTPHLSITVTAKSADRLAETVAFALERDLPFNLNFLRDHRCVSPSVNLADDQARLIDGMKAAFAVIEKNLPKHSIIAGLLDRASFSQPHEYPCGVGNSYLVIDHQGRIARCQMEMTQTVGNITQDDPVVAMRRVTDYFQNVSVEAKAGCQACIWKFWCAGGCPLLAFKTTGQSDVKSPYCGVYQSLYPDLVRLEGLRLLRWASS